MTDHDRAPARREITNALMNALERRHEVLDLIVKADDRPSAVDGIVELLDTSRLGAEAVIGMSFDQLTKDSRKKIVAELEDLNNILSFTFKDRPASAGETLALAPFRAAPIAISSPPAPRRWVPRVTAPAPRPVGWTMKSVRRRTDSRPKRPPGSSRLMVTRRSAWSSASSRDTKCTSASGFTRTTGIGATAPQRWPSLGRRWRRISRRCRW